jgi:hypothetical protein
VTYEWVRLVLAAVSVLPPLAFVALMRPSRRPLAPLPAWVTWSQSLALTTLYAGVVGASVEAITAHRYTPSLWAQLLLFAGYGGLGIIRYVLLAWWLRDRRARRLKDRLQPTGKGR